MKRALVASALVVAVAACAAHAPPDAQVIDARSPAARSAPSSPPSESGSPFPAGPGVEFMKDDLEDAAGASDYHQGYADRLDRVRKILGSEGEEVSDGVAFRGVGARTKTSTLDCWELAVLRQDPYARVLRVDRRLCGLPYGELASTPKNTLRRVERVVAEMKSLGEGGGEGMAHVRLGDPDEAKASRWWAVGPRDSHAPLTCHVLSFVDGKPQLEKKALGACGIDWPPPANAFTRDETTPARHRSEEAAECLTKCTTSSACIVRRVTAKTTGKIVERGDDVFAVEADGRPARIDVAIECLSMPAWCTAAPNRTCLPPCVTPTEDSPSSHFGRAANGVWTLTCDLTKKK